MTSLSIRRFLAPFAVGLAVLTAACGSADADDPTATSAANTPAAAASVTAPASFPGGPSSSLALTGAVEKPASYDLAALKALARNTVTTNPQAGSGQLGEHSYSGPLLIDLLNAAGMKQDANVKNDLLRRSIVITGSDGYKTVIAWGEIDPRFAARQVLLAYERDGEALPAEDGFARLIVPGDVFAGRYISNVVGIEVKDTIAAPATGARGATSQFDLSGAVTTPGTVTLRLLYRCRRPQARCRQEERSAHKVGRRRRLRRLRQRRRLCRGRCEVRQQADPDRHQPGRCATHGRRRLRKTRRSGRQC